MHRTFLALAVVAMAGFISLAHADIVGKGKTGEACHAVNGVGDKLNDGLYSDTDMSDSHKNEHTWCCGPGSSKRTCFNCDNDRVTCTDGKAQ